MDFARPSELQHRGDGQQAGAVGQPRRRGGPSIRGTAPGQGSADAAEHQQKQRHRNFCPHAAGFYDEVYHGQGTDGIGNIIGANRHGHAQAYDDSSYPNNAVESARATSKGGQLPADRSFQFRAVDPPPLTVFSTR